MGVFCVHKPGFLMPGHIYNLLSNGIPEITVAIGNSKDGFPM